MNFRPLTIAGLAITVTLLFSGACARSDPGAASKSPDSKQTVLITGANRGIGLEFARQYAADGWHVIGTAREPAQATELRDTGAEVLQLDVTDQQSVERLSRDLGDRPVDLLINNAGILPRAATIAETNLDDLSRVLAVNTAGPVRVTQAVLPALRNGSGKVIVNITSQLGSIANNRSGGFYGYRESKAALNMFTRSLAAELGPDGFICVVIHPGWVRTDMGGPSAPVQPPESVAGMRAVIAELTPEKNGTFWTFQGKPVPW